MGISMDQLRHELIGANTFIPTPFGDRLITYADYTASGKSLKFIEKYLIKIQEVYANSHTEESRTGKTMTELMHASTHKIKKQFNALNDYVIPVGTGATGAIQKLATILGVYYSPVLKDKLETYFKDRSSKNCDKDCTNDFFDQIVTNRPVVFISSYEHHSNDLIWREGLAEVVEIGLTEDGLFDLLDLKTKLSDSAYKNRMKIGSFSAASNVTGVKSPVYEIARMLHDHGAYACFDFAASGPYVKIDMNKDEFSYFDAIYLSPHKFIGGPGSSGLLIINKALYNTHLAPTIAGGGTVDYVSSKGYDFTDNVEARETAGTPGILQLIKAALAIELKDTVGIDAIEKKEHDYIKRVFDRLLKNPNISILGPQDPDKRIGILSFNIKYDKGFLHHKFVTKLLNDLFGIQSRAGCACAGPYGHRLLNVSDEASLKYRNVVHEGYNSLKPGWVRVNFHYIMTESEVDYICDAMEFIAEYGYLFVKEYHMDLCSGIWNHATYDEPNEILATFGVEQGFSFSDTDVFQSTPVDQVEAFKLYMTEANALATKLKKTFQLDPHRFNDDAHDSLRWYPF